MIETSTLITDIKGDFEGGASLSVNWDTVIRRGVENVIENCRPETLKRRAPLYGALAKDVFIYYCPPDVLVPSAIYTNDGKRKFTYVPPRVYYEQEKDNHFTIEYLNGARFIVVRHALVPTSLTIDAMDAVGTKTGGSPALNEHNYLSGGAAVEATFTDAGVEFGDDMTEDITDYYLRGIAVIPAYIPTAANLTSLELRLKTSDSAYYKVITTQDDIDDYIVDGWNILRFSLANKTTVGSPNPATITEWSIIGTTDSGTTLKIIFDKFTLQNFTPYYLQYYSNRAYVDGATGALWKETVDSGNADKINMDRDVSGILHYECCLIVQQSGTYTQRDPAGGQGFAEQLRRKYQNYWAVHPSDEQPHSYSKSPEIDVNQDEDLLNTQDETISDDE